jgi:hypothetical protein
MTAVSIDLQPIRGAASADRATAALGLENANELALPQEVTPDHLQGRVNTTTRSINRVALALSPFRDARHQAD